MICKLKERGTAFLRRLAIQFSKTELRPSIREKPLSSRALTAAESRRQPFCVKEGGLLPCRPEYVKRKTRNQRLELPPDAKELTSTSTPPHPSNPPGNLSVRTRGAALIPSTGTPSSKRQVSLQLPPGVPLGRVRLLSAVPTPVKNYRARAGGHPSRP